jgi:hypothetical protein
MTSKRLGRGAFGCVVTNAACPGTVLPPEDVASKIFFRPDSIDDEVRVSDIIRRIDPAGEFSVSMQNACRTNKGRYSDSVKDFCGLTTMAKSDPLVQADYEYAGTTVFTMVHDGAALFSSFGNFMWHMNNMHTTHHLGHFDVKPNNAVYDENTNRIRMVDWSTLAHRPREAWVEGYSMYPPESGFLTYNSAGNPLPVPEHLGQKWWGHYVENLSMYAIFDEAVRTEIIERNMPLFLQFVSNPDNARVFRYDNADLWSGSYLGRFDSFGIGMIGGYLYSCSRFPNVPFKNHIMTLLAGLLSAVPSENILYEAVVYIKWIVDVCLPMPDSVRDASFAAHFPVLRTAPIPMPAVAFPGPAFAWPSPPAAAASARTIKASLKRGFEPFSFDKDETPVGRKQRAAPSPGPAAFAWAGPPPAAAAPARTIEESLKRGLSSFDQDEDAARFGRRQRGIAAEEAAPARPIEESLKRGLSSFDQDEDAARFGRRQRGIAAEEAAPAAAGAQYRLKRGFEPFSLDEDETRFERRPRGTEAEAAAAPIPAWYRHQQESPNRGAAFKYAFPEQFTAGSPSPRDFEEEEKNRPNKRRGGRQSKHTRRSVSKKPSKKRRVSSKRKSSKRRR